MALHFLPHERVRKADLVAVPAHLYLHPGVLMCQHGDILTVDGYGTFRVLTIVWGGEHKDEADIHVEVVQ